MSRPSFSRALTLGLAGFLFVAASAEADELRVVSSGGFAAAYRALAPEFEHESGVTLVSQWGPSSGALGIIINKPIGETSIASVFEALGQKASDVAGDMRVFSGGPIQPEVGFVVHSADYRRPETVAVNDRLSMTSSLDILRDIGARKGPAKILVAFGYTGWGPNQLECEIDERAWGIAEADPALVFDEERDKVWDHAWEHRAQKL